ncbi:transcriptional regulator [Streptomyces sp. NPDC004031]
MTDAELHPLAYLLAVRGLTAEAYLRRVADQHQAMGYGQMATRREKVSRWIAGTHSPTYQTQLAMAALEGRGPDIVHAHGWPGWLLLITADDIAVVTAPWTTTAALHALTITGGPVDRRKFMITTTTALGAVAAQWSDAAAAVAAAPTAARRPQIDGGIADFFDRRLDDLRHLDDRIGSGQVYDAALAELNLIKTTITSTTHSQAVRKRLFSAAAEASRAAGWTAYDSGNHAAAELHYAAALRTAAEAGDLVTGANTAAFWAIQHYSNGDPRGAIALLDTALSLAPRIGSPRMTAMLYARACRAHARAGDPRAADRAAGAALAAYDHAGPVADDPGCVYWVNRGEIHQLLGSSSLNLRHPATALRHFQDATAAHAAEAYDGDAFPRGHAIYLARLAEAHLDLGDLDAAAAAAHDAVARMGGITSARGTSTLTDLRTKLARHRGVPVIRDVLHATG